MPDDLRFPDELRYSPEHLWLRVEGEVARAGITDFAQDQLGEIVFVKLPEVGEQVQFMIRMGDIESLKIVSELFSPLSGVVREVNVTLEQSPEVINTDPYGQGWLVVVQISAPDEIGQLLDAAGYSELIQQETPGS